MRSRDRAGPLDTEMAKRPGGRETASVRRSLSRLCLSLAEPGDLNGAGMDWQPIETAPKDGTKILVFCPWLGVCGPATWNICQYAKNPKPFWTHWGERIWGTSRVRIDQPTHWMPMPEGPNVRVNRHFAVGRVWARILEPKLGPPQSVRLNDQLGSQSTEIKNQALYEQEG